MNSEATPATSLRTGANAVIIHNNSILLVEFDDGTLHYNLPGGGVEPGESIHAALHREVYEETCCTVVVGRLLLVWEYYPPHHNNLYGTRHKLGLVFLCSLTGNDEPHLPDKPDTHQTAVRWMPLAQLEHVPLLPQIGKPIINALRTPSEDYFLIPR